MMHLLKIIPRIRTRPNRRGLTKLGCMSFSTTTEEKIEIPKRIPRGPTDILRALESTVGRDPTASHYKYHDDPYLIPMSNSGKRTFAMAQEAGRKAAHWVRREHADLFQHQEADPPIDLFFPPMIYNEDSKVEVADLQKIINTAQITDAKLVYKLLTQQNVEISPEIEQSLLELLCYQNCEDSISEEFIEERWFKQSSGAKEKTRKTWKDGDFAEGVFINMKIKTPEAYAAIIQGMTKYHQVNRAWQLFEESQQNNIVLNTNTFNSLIQVSNFIKEDFNLRWSLVTDLLKQMREVKLKPNLGTLNAVLHSLSNMGNPGLAKQNTLKVLSEFKQLGIEPSLASWHYVLLTFCKDRGPRSTILHDIIDLLENKEHTIRDLRDTKFFVTAMDLARHHLRDVNLAKRINSLLHHGNNYNLIGDSYKESVYFRNYFALLCANLPLDEFMSDVYEKLVPHIYVPEPGIMEEVLKQVDANGAVEYIPQLWSDMVSFDHTHRFNLIESVAHTMTNNEQLLSSEINEKFAYIGWDMYERINNQDELRINKMNFTGDLLGNILVVLLRNKDFNKACAVIDKFDKDQQQIAGIPKVEALALFVDQCIEEKAPTKAIKCIQYCADCGFPEANSLAVKLKEKLNLDEVYLSRLSKIVGDVVLQHVEES